MRVMQRSFVAIILLFAVGAARADAPPISAAQQFESERSTLVADLATLSRTLEGQLGKDDVKAAESLYGLELRAIALVQYAESHDIASAGSDHSQTTSNARATLQRILRYEERMKTHAQSALDLALPGEPDRKLVATRGKDLTQKFDGKLAKLSKIDAYAPLYRKGTPKPGEAEMPDTQRLAEMRADFVAKGGDLKRDIKMLGEKYLDKLPSGQLAEWTQLDSNRVAITTEGAKHPVIGGGRKVRGAGSLKVYRDDSGKIVLAVLSNSSGNYKPGVSSVEGVVQKLVDLGLPEDHILTTSIVPAEPELVKLLLKSKQTMSKDQIDEHVAKLRTRANLRVATATIARAR